MIDGVLQAQLDALEWSDLARVSRLGAELLAVVSEPACLRACLAGLPESELFAHCEHKPFQDKVVLYRSPVNGVSLRMHVYLPGHRERAQYIHNHRWSFAARIVTGGYEHRVYEQVAAADFRLSMLREEHAGNFYTLDHAAFHTVRAAADTVTLLLRGATVKRTAYYIHEDQGHSFQHFGGEEEPSATRDARRMTRAYHEELIARLRRRGVV
jgi:hypothetical protein